MRKSSGIVMAIVLLAFGSMMFAANVALKPYQRYARIGSEMTSMLRNLGLVREDTKVFVHCRAGGGEKRLAQDGFGMLIELAPTEAVMKRPGRLERLTYRACEEAFRAYRRNRDRELDWFEVKLLFPDEQAHRALLTLGEDGRLGRPEPKVPAVYPPGAATPVRRPSRAGG